MRIRLPLAALLPLCSLLAQTPTPVSYPADTLRGGSGNPAPLGLVTSNMLDEARWQQLIPARYLPSTGCAMTGLALNCQASFAPVTYTSLVVTLSQTTATALGSSFSGNLPLPVVVYSGANAAIQWSTNAWGTIPFAAPYAYYGTDNLVVAVTKVYDRVTNPVPGTVAHQTSGAPSRDDLGAARYVFGVPGSGASTGDLLPYSGPPLSMRLLCVGPGTLTVGSVTQPNGREFEINTNMDLTVWAIDNTVWLTLLDGAFTTPIAVPGVNGLLRVRPRIILASGSTFGGSSLLTLGIPNDPQLVGAYLVMQSLLIGPSLNSFDWSNAVDLYVNG